jgi:hypothetical protein
MGWSHLATSLGLVTKAVSDPEIYDEEKCLERAIRDMRKWRDAKREHKAQYGMDAFVAASGLTRAAFKHGVVLYDRAGHWPGNWTKEDVAHARKYVDRRDRMPRMTDVYKHYGIAKRTAWSVINGRHPPSKRTRTTIANAYASKGPYELKGETK